MAIECWKRWLDKVGQGRLVPGKVEELEQAKAAARKGGNVQGGGEGQLKVAPIFNTLLLSTLAAMSFNLVRFCFLRQCCFWL